MTDVSAPNRALRAAADKLGGQSAMARLLRVSQAAVWKWIAEGKSLPTGPEGENYVLTVERETGISRHQLRPDLYPVETTPTDAHLDHAAAGRSTSTMEPAR